jgi:CheY-like chemotaxis protein
LRRRPLTRDKQHALAIVTNDYDPIHVNGDLARLVQCVVNLLANAAKYTDCGGRIEVQARVEGAHAVIEVIDNGPGIAAELLPQLFDLFVQGNRTLDRSQGGLGIGLSVVKRLVEMHDGEVTARSAGLGHGAAFAIRLPRIPAPASVVTAGVAQDAPRRRVLIVDDNQDAANSLALVLDHKGHETRVVYSARSALELVQSFSPDVALLDIGLAEMDGYDLARHLRAKPGLDGLRLVAVTGYGQAEDRERSKAAGFDDHIVKPVDLLMLERALTTRHVS